MSTDQPKNVSDDKASSTEKASSNEKASSSTAPIGIYIFFFVEMKCFLCQFEADIPTLKDHYQKYHLIDSTDENFLNISNLII